MRRIFAALFGVLIIAWAAPTLAQDSAAEKLQGWESTLTDIERKLAVQGPSPLFPETWRTALSDGNVTYRTIPQSAMQWWRNLQIAEMDKLAIGIGTGILLIAGVLAFPVRRWVLAKWGPTAQTA